jgi:predicted DsbA family dithiol-disulfide isomerase
MKIEIWSDIMCPFCYMGKRKLEQALEQFPFSTEVQIVFRSFELDPNAKRDVDFDIYDMLSSKYGMSREQAIAMNAQIAEQARELGLIYRFDTMILTNTFDAHRLTHWAARHGKQAEMTERLFRACFTDSLHIGKHETLIGLAEEIGLNRAETADMLAGETCAEEVRRDEREAARLGIRAVPYFLFDRKFAVSGAQPVDVFLEALRKGWDKHVENIQ